MQRWILHIDMDAFFASVEQMDDPSLRGRPVIVGGGARGVVASASYEARRFGVRSAMPLGEARRLCPRAVFVPGRRGRYAELSRKIAEILASFSPLVEPASIDEAYLDATGLERLFGPVEELTSKIRDAVRSGTGGLTCSIGAAHVKFLAKIASEVNKPAGVFILRPEDAPDFLHSLPVERLPGVGQAALRGLASLGVVTVADVLRYPESFWERRMGAPGRALFARAMGRDERAVLPGHEAKSESAEQTFDEDSLNRDFLRRRLMAQAERIGARLRAKRLAARVVTLKIRYADFRRITRSRTLPKRICSTEGIFAVACGLLDALALEAPVRLIGLGVSRFEETREQARLPLADAPNGLDCAEERRARLDRAFDAIRARFGEKTLIRGILFQEIPPEDGRNAFPAQKTRTP
jgi:DNA polymerase-4